MKRLLNLLVVTLLMSEVISQTPLFGRCPYTTVVQNFDVQRYLGRWFEIRSYPTVFQTGGVCTEANYSLNPNGTVAVLNKSVGMGRPFSITGEAVLVTPGQGRLTVNFPGSPVSSTPNYLVLGTDYSNFAVVHTCRQLTKLTNNQFAWVLSRTRTLSSASASQVKIILKLNGVKRERFMETSQTNCL